MVLKKKKKKEHINFLNERARHKLSIDTDINRSSLETNPKIKIFTSKFG